MSNRNNKKEIMNRLMKKHFMTYEDAEEAYNSTFSQTQDMGKGSRKKNRNKYKQQKVNKVTIADRLKNYKIHVVGYSTSTGDWTNMQHVNSIEEADLVMFTGGEDVNPKYYNEPVGNRTSFNDARDVREIAAFKKAISLGKKVIGICRGAQLACVMAGGTLIQHADNHTGGTHEMTLVSFTPHRKVSISSAHHQMCYPYVLPESKYRVLGYSTEKKSKVYLDGNNNQIMVPKNFRECEVVLFTEIKALAIQGHPEWMAKTHATITTLQDMLLTFMMLKEIKN